MAIRIHGPHRFERPDGNGGISVHYGVYATVREGRAARRKLFDTPSIQPDSEVQAAAQAWAEAELASIQGR